MRRIIIASLGLTALAACGPSGGLVGVGLSDWATETGFGHIGTSVVCLGSDAGERGWEFSEEEGALVIAGTVISDERNNAQIGNMDTCWAPPGRVITIEGPEGVHYRVGYRWQSESLGDMTPDIAVEPGEPIRLTYRTTESSGAAGFSIVADDEIVYAMESGRGAPALRSDDLPGMTVRTGEPLVSSEDDCGRFVTNTLTFESDSGDSRELAPGEDTPFTPGSESQSDEPERSLLLCNINSFEYSDDACSEGVSEESWILYGRYN